MKVSIDLPKGDLDVSDLNLPKVVHINHTQDALMKELETKTRAANILNERSYTLQCGLEKILIMTQGANRGLLLKIRRAALQALEATEDNQNFNGRE
jgi:hypothetical protein